MTASVLFGPLLRASCAAATLALALPGTLQAQGRLPVTPEWRATAQQVAEAGVPLSELAPNAPDSHTVRPGDTLWDLSAMFLKSPWRWPELWGMNLEQIRNPHLIYPGQLLVLVRSGDRAVLRVGQAVGGSPSAAGGAAGGSPTLRLSPRVRAQALADDAIASIPLNLIGPFLNEAVVFEPGQFEQAPRIVATQEGRVMLSRGDTAYVRGELGGQREFRLFRQPRPLLDPDTGEVLGHEGVFVGTAQFVREGQSRSGAESSALVPATFTVTSTRLEAGVGDRLAPVPPRELTSFAPRSPTRPVAGRLISVYGEALTAGQNQIVTLNRGARDGLERGHVLALWRAGRMAVDTTVEPRQPLQLPDERHGLLFVFRVFERVSYALILQVKEPVRAGDRFTQP